MSRHVALLRAVNLGGYNSVPKGELKAICERAGFTDVTTYLASGNVVFRSDDSELQVKSALEAEVAAFAGKHIPVIIRSGQELAGVLAANPYASMRPDRTVAIFLDNPPSSEVLEGVTGRRDEEIKIGKREIYVHYGEGMGTSRLKIKGAAEGTARNINTIAKLVELASRP